MSVLARGRQPRRDPGRGLTLVEPDGSVVDVPGVLAADDATALGPHDVVVLASKAHQLAEVATRLEALYGHGTVVVPLQNGVPWWFFQRFGGPYAGHRLVSLDPDGTIERHVPAERIVGCVAYPAAEREAPGVVPRRRWRPAARGGAGRHALASRGGDRGDADVGGLHVAGADRHPRPSVGKAWGNLAMNPISALTGATLVEICGWPATRTLAAEMMREAGEVAARLGLRLRVSIEQRIEGAASVGADKTSMLQDVEAGRPLELAPLVGAFVELGELTDTPMPATRTVLDLASLLDARLRGEA